MAELLIRKKEFIFKYHEHDSLLENVEEEELDEDERKVAWENYEAEREGRLQKQQQFIGNFQQNRKLEDT